MNRLEEYRDAKALEEGAIDFHEGNMERGFRDGFNAAIALELPLKFHYWLVWLRDDSDNVEFRHHMESIGEEQPIETFYKYWIENIYKAE